MGTPRSHRLQVGFSPAQRSAIGERARDAGLSLSSTVRQLVSTSLSLEQTTGASDPPAALAALVAAEHAVLMVASVLPEGQRRMHELAPQAALAAEERLATVRESGL
jgi:hypothetical protein